MDRALIRGQPSALAAAESMLRGGMPHALLLVGLPSSGKTTLALDIAAALLCVDPDPAARPCRSCRGCRLVASGNHPDLHRLAPGGAGDQVKLASTQQDPRPGVRDLVEDLALSSAEGGARVAIVERAHRMNEDAQNALLKTLEEPARGVHLILCADDEDRLLPTIRSRCARIRLGTVAPRAIEAWLVERGASDTPTAARVARLAEGRPGLALAYAGSPAAVADRAEVDRVLLDLLAERLSLRLAAAKPLLVRAGALTAALAGPAGPDGDAGTPGRGRRRPATGRRTDSPAAATDGTASSDRASRGDGSTTEAEHPAEASAMAGPSTGPSDGSDDEEDRPAKTPASERRRAALTLIELWRELTVDLARATRGDLRRIHDPGLLEGLAAAAGRLPVGPTVAFLARLDRAARVVELSASPELAVDALLVAWPRLEAA
jgi:DNA polymerase III subunit delta'